MRARKIQFLIANMWIIAAVTLYSTRPNTFSLVWLVLATAAWYYSMWRATTPSTLYRWCVDDGQGNSTTVYAHSAEQAIAIAAREVFDLQAERIDDA